MWNCIQCGRVNREVRLVCLNCRTPRSGMDIEETPEQHRRIVRIAELLSKRRGEGLTESEALELRNLQEEVGEEGRGSQHGPLALLG